MKKMGFALIFGVLVGATVAARAEDKPAPKEAAKLLKVVVHINFSDAERQKHGLKNLSNILREVNGEAEIVVVCHGDGIGLLVKDKSQNAEQVERLIKEKVRFAACENTLKDKAISKDKLLPGVTTTPSGAVEVIRKQQAGFGYFKP